MSKEPETSTVVEVAAGIIHQHGRYLVAKRNPGVMFANLWEFPGGKRHSGESLEDCLKREMREELGIEIEVHDLVHEALYPYYQSVLILYFYNCSITGGNPRPLGCQEFRWVSPQHFPEYSFPPANTPLVKELTGHPSQS